MNITTSSVLSALRDIEGVLGSFVIDADGHILARDLPAMFEPSALTNASLHLSRLRAALESTAAGFDSCVARFGRHLVILRALRGNTLCVLCPEGTNLPAVQMSSTLIARRLTGTAPVAYTDEPADPRSRTEGRVSSAEDVTASPQSRRFRGRSL